MSIEQPDILVLVVDDHELTRFSLKLLLSNQRKLKVIGLASNGKEAVDLVKHHHPDVVILDLQMPIMDGLTAASKIKQINPQTQIIAYSSLKDPQTEVMSQTAPIDVFFGKDAVTEELIESVNLLGQRSRQSTKYLQGKSAQEY